MTDVTKCGTSAEHSVAYITSSKRHFCSQEWHTERDSLRTD